ncbi:hypothetical protein QE152_g12768 [Popillia japonica]|uniref:Uncharacterized protein n=1 Tax=Popillia japonica TaxID=7064 RepID=A0AAW1LPD2_POPJA
MEAHFRTHGHVLQSAGIHPYKRKPVQLLLDDFDRRIEFCQAVMNRIDGSEILPDWSLFSEEAVFTLNGKVNHHKCRCPLSIELDGRNLSILHI